jgi:hypothetical protein
MNLNIGVNLIQRGTCFADTLKAQNSSARKIINFSMKIFLDFTNLSPLEVMKIPN